MSLTWLLRPQPWPDPGALHPSIVLIVDTYVSVLPALAMQAAEKTARLVAEAGQYAPGSNHVTRRKANPPGRGRRRRHGSTRRPTTSSQSSTRLADRRRIVPVAMGKEVEA